MLEGVPKVLEVMLKVLDVLKAYVVCRSVYASWRNCSRIGMGFALNLFAVFSPPFNPCSMSIRCFNGSFGGRGTAIRMISRLAKASILEREVRIMTPIQKDFAGPHES